MHFLFTVGNKYNFIINTLLNVIDFTIPNIKVNECKIRYPAEIKELVNKKKQLYNLSKVNPENYKLDYKIISRKLREKLKKLNDLIKSSIIKKGGNSLYNYIKKKS